MKYSVKSMSDTGRLANTHYFSPMNCLNLNKFPPLIIIPHLKKKNRNLKEVMKFK